MKYNIKTAVATGIAAAYLAGCSALPQRADYKEDGNFTGNLAEATAHYAQQETALDAAQAQREVRCLESMADDNVSYKSETGFFIGLSQCERYERNKDKLVYGLISGAIDLSKLLLIYEGIDSLTSSSSSSTTPSGNGGLEEVITGGGSTSNGGSVINP